jgi:acetyl-CoA C-acetyltransferase
MTDVVIAGIGQTPVGEFWDVPLRTLAVQAIRHALDDSGGLTPQVLYAGNALAANLSHQAHLATLLADHAGLNGIEAATLENGSASGASALRQGYLAVKSGLVDVALVVGVEKVTDGIGADAETALATAGDSEYESVHGLTPTAQAALLAQRYQHEFNPPPNALAGFPLTSHANAAGNRNAMYPKAVSLETYQKSETVCDPLNLFDIAPYADGAAAVVLCRADLPIPAQQKDRPRVHITASSSVTDTLGLHSRPDPLVFTAAGHSVEQALLKAGLALEQVDLFEYWDAFSIYAALALESAGFARHGEGWKLAADGAILRTGQIPCATLGGLKARGHPLGASGVYQAVEATLQLRGQAGSCQVEGVRTAMLQALAGPASLAVTHILQIVEKE